MTLASILRAQLATGRPLRVTRALLEALDASETDGGDLAAYARASAAERELADLDLVLPVACGSRVDAVREIEQERDDARRERDEALAHEERLAEQAGGRLLDAVNRAERLERERDEERARANEWCAQKHDAERQRDEALRASDDYAQRYAVAMLNGSRAFTERDEARRELAEAQQSLRERVAEREALCERVSVLEETMAKVRPDVCREESIDAIDAARAEVERLRDVLQCMRTNYDSACERAGWRELGEVAVLLGYARGAAEDFGEVDVVDVREAVSRLRSTSWPAERRDIAIREAEERGARWALEDAIPCACSVCMEGKSQARVERICAEARKRGEHG